MAGRGSFLLVDDRLLGRRLRLPDLALQLVVLVPQPADVLLGVVEALERHPDEAVLGVRPVPHYPRLAGRRVEQHAAELLDCDDLVAAVLRLALVAALRRR